MTNPVNVTNRSSQELESALKHKATIANTASGTEAMFTTDLSSRPPFQQLSYGEQEELKAMLDDDVWKMKRLFGHLVTNTRDSVEEQIPVIIFATFILALKAYEPAPGERNRSLLDEHSKEIINAKSISEIFNILCSYWNYLNYEILEHIIEAFGTDKDKERLKSYNEKLRQFCKRRIFELPLPESCSDAGNTLSPKQEKFVVKLNVREDITGKELLRIKRKIAEILRVKLATLNIYSVDRGCVQLTFLIPKFVAQAIFPLSDEQTSALSKDMSMIRLKCGDYVFKVLDVVIVLVYQRVGRLSM